MINEKHGSLYYTFKRKQCYHKELYLHYHHTSKFVTLTFEFLEVSLQSFTDNLSSPEMRHTKILLEKVGKKSV